MADPTTPCLLVTGANGYIGTSLIRVAQAAGWAVRVLGRVDAPGIQAFQWRLGQDVDDDALRDVTAVVHLAHQWHMAKSRSDDINLRGTELLLQACRRNGVPRFVMASTISARPDALNHYGREKSQIEQLLRHPNEIAARIGIVYGRQARGMWGMLCRLAQLPVLPMVGIAQPTQPIAMDELCAGLLALAAKKDLQHPWYGLAAAKPITFGNLLRTISRVKYGKPLWLIPLSLPLVLFMVGIAEKIIPAINRERVYGLVGLPYLECSASLQELDLQLTPVEDNLRRYVQTRQLLTEGRILLRYILGHAPHHGLLRHYVRGVRAYGGGHPIALPFVARLHPALLRLAEPLRKPAASTMRLTLSSRLEMAVILAESDPRGAARMYDYRGHRPVRVAFNLGLTLVSEAFLLPCRLIYQLCSSGQSKK